MISVKTLKIGDKILLIKPIEMALEFVKNGTIAEVKDIQIEPATQFFKEIVWITIEYQVKTKHGIRKERGNLRQEDLDAGYAKVI